MFSVPFILRSAHLCRDPPYWCSSLPPFLFVKKYTPKKGTLFMHTTLPKTIRTTLMGTILLCMIGTTFVIPPRKVEAAEPVSLTVVAIMVSIVAAKNLATFLAEKCPQLNFNASCQKSLRENGKKIVDRATKEQQLPPISSDQAVVIYSLILQTLSKSPTLIKEKPVLLSQLYTLFTPWLGKPVIEKIRFLEKTIKDGFTCKTKDCVRNVAQTIQRITRFKPGELAAVCSSYSLVPESSSIKYCTGLENTVFDGRVTGSAGIPSQAGAIPTTTTSTNSVSKKHTSCENSSSTSTKNLTEKQKNTIRTEIVKVLYSSPETSIGINYRAFIESKITDKNKNLINVLKTKRVQLINSLKCLGVTNIEYQYPDSPIIDAKCHGTPCIIILVPSVYLPTYKKPFIGTLEEWKKLVNKYNKNKNSS